MKQIIDSLGMTKYQFSKHYNIPYTTVLQWYKGERKPPEYVVTLFKEKIERDKNGEQLEIPLETVYFCYAKSQNDLTGCYRTSYIENAKKFLKNAKGKNKEIELHHIIRIFNEKEFEEYYEETKTEIKKWN